MKKILIIIGVILVLIFAANGFKLPKFNSEKTVIENIVDNVNPLPPDPDPIDTGSVIIEQIKSTAKMITKEVSISEHYKWSDYNQGYKWNMFKKEAVLIVKAKAMLGFDLSVLTYSADPSNKVITIDNVPTIEILSLAHSTEWINVEEGYFNSFTEQERNEINNRAKRFATNVIQHKIDTGDIALGQEPFTHMRNIASVMGWTVVVKISEKPQLNI